MKKSIYPTLRSSLAGLLLAMGVSVSAYADDHAVEPTWEGLVPIEESASAIAYVHPKADFSVFQRVALLEPHVAFRSNWKRDQNRSRSRSVRASDVARIKDDVSGVFMQVFEETLEAAGFDIVNYVDEDVLILSPAIIDLDINAPDTRGPGRTRTYTSTTGSATLILDLIDAQSGALIGRAADRRVARRGAGFAIAANRVTNRADARREMRVWANRLVEFLEQHYVSAGGDD